tara:strand:+ start:379 stop:537 length:159 start_codon:yes stop_codon:yes gene_type:complete
MDTLTINLKGWRKTNMNMDRLANGENIFTLKTDIPSTIEGVFSGQGESPYRR